MDFELDSNKGNPFPPQAPQSTPHLSTCGHSSSPSSSSLSQPPLQEPQPTRRNILASTTPTRQHHSISITYPTILQSRPNARPVLKLPHSLPNQSLQSRQRRPATLFLRHLHQLRHPRLVRHLKKDALARPCHAIYLARALRDPENVPQHLHHVGVDRFVSWDGANRHSGQSRDPAEICIILRVKDLDLVTRCKAAGQLLHPRRVPADHVDGRVSHLV